MNTVTAHVGGIFRHKAKGSTYIVLGFCRIEATWKRGVRYVECVDGFAVSDAEEIVRDLEEFEDGRFELVRQQGVAA